MKDNRTKINVACSKMSSSKGKSWSNLIIEIGDIFKVEVNDLKRTNAKECATILFFALELKELKYFNT